MRTLSDNAVAVLILLNAQKHVANRFDGSWWPLNFAMWSIIPTLRGDEWAAVHFMINYSNRRRADCVTASAHTSHSAA